MNASPDFTAVKQAALSALHPIRPADKSTRAAQDFLFSAKEADASRNLPPYYLLYFLLVDLLGFKNLGQFEKISWSIPIEFKGDAFLIEHRKFGVGIFAHDLPTQEPQAAEISSRLSAAAKVAEPFFDWLADEAVAASKLNVVNRTDDLSQRFEYFLSEYRRLKREEKKRSDEYKRTLPSERQNLRSSGLYERFWPHQQAAWLASTTIDAFFSWTEHVFIHLAILQGRVVTGAAVAKLSADDWATKFKSALDISDQNSKKFYDNLIEIRRQHRNFVAHGSFGKKGEAFQFHSWVGAVPVLLPHRSTGRRYSLTGPDALADPDAISVIESFIDHLWSDSRAPARIYLQRSSLPVILTMATDGTYREAMTSSEKMSVLVERLVHQSNRAANMDW